MLFVQNEGRGFRLKAAVLKEAFDRGGPVLHLLLRHTQALMTQMVQAAACNKHHALDQQFCRWLPLSLDRSRGNQLDMTQQLIANILGVSPSQVATGALALQSARLIRYANGRIAMLDRAEVERRPCERHAVVKVEYERLLRAQVAA